MKKLHWSYEKAYRKLFFLRFFLLLVVLILAIALAYITFHKEPEINMLASPVSADPVAGTYKSEDAIIELIPIQKAGYELPSNDEYVLLGNASWKGENPGQVNIGELKGVATLVNNQIIFDDGNGCMVNISMSTNGFEAEDNHQCGGLNVSFSGNYIKTK